MAFQGFGSAVARNLYVKGDTFEHAFGNYRQALRPRKCRIIQVDILCRDNHRNAFISWRPIPRIGICIYKIIRNSFKEHITSKCLSCHGGHFTAKLHAGFKGARFKATYFINSLDLAYFFDVFFIE